MHDTDRDPPSPDVPGEGKDHLDFLLEWQEPESDATCSSTDRIMGPSWGRAAPWAAAGWGPPTPAEPPPSEDPTTSLEDGEPDLEGTTSAADASASADAFPGGQVPPAPDASPPAPSSPEPERAGSPVGGEQPAPGGLEAGERPGAADADDAPEFFEWTADRHRAIEKALGEAPSGALPRVHSQLEAVAGALENGALALEEALHLLAEVEAYLEQRNTHLGTRVPVAHAAVIDSRADRQRALDAYSEALASLREYLATGDAIHLQVARYATEQGSSFLACARSVILAAEPEAPPATDEPPAPAAPEGAPHSVPGEGIAPPEP